MINLPTVVTQQRPTENRICNPSIAKSDAIVVPSRQCLRQADFVVYYNNNKFNNNRHVTDDSRRLWNGDEWKIRIIIVSDDSRLSFNKRHCCACAPSANPARSRHFIRYIHLLFNNCKLLCPEVNWLAKMRRIVRYTLQTWSVERQRQVRFLSNVTHHRTVFAFTATQQPRRCTLHLSTIM